MASNIKQIKNFHREIARRVARGDTNEEILAEIKIKPSTLSTLKSNPLFQNVVAEYQNRLDDNFIKAHKALEDGAVKVAEELINCATNPNINPNDRIRAGLGIWDRLNISRGQSQKPGKSGEQEIVFEQMLRVVKRQMDGPDEPDDESTQEALRQLESLGPDDAQEADWTEVG